MGQSSPEILVYITDNKERIISGDPLTLYIPDSEEREICLTDLGKALRADVVQLKKW
uniref:capping complex subunit for YIEGIA n=1 Tax=Clostridium sp. NkU-1 TaxID=1095009 RepID=UPI000B117150